MEKGEAIHYANLAISQLVQLLEQLADRIDLYDEDEIAPEDTFAWTVVKMARRDDK